MKGTVKRVKESVKHQDIGGKLIHIEEEWDIDDVIFKGAFGGNWACWNFLERRSDVLDTRPRVFYGKVGILGYVVAEDELLDVIE